MKYSIAFLPLICQASIAVASDDIDHAFIRRVQTPPKPPPQCGEPECWCDVAVSDLTDCPTYPFNSIYTAKTDVANFFTSLELENPEYKDLKLCYPDLSTSINHQGIKVNPAILCNEGILVEEVVVGKSSKKSKASKSSTKCMEKCKHHPESAVCGIRFMHDGSSITPDSFDTNCMSEMTADSYMMKTFRNDKKRKKNGYFKLHEGACGVCSTAQDIAAYMKYSFPDQDNPHPTIDTMSFLCHMTLTQTNPDLSPKELVDRVSVCLQKGIPGTVPAAGLSETCSYAWAVNVFLTGLPEETGGCNSVCTDMLGLIITGSCIPNNKCPYDPADCSLQDCLKCDDSVSGSQFIELSGMTRRNAGIHTLLPRSCGSLAEMSHTCVAEGV